MKNKNGISVFGWIVIIIAITILLSFIILPPVFRMMYNKEDEIDYNKIVSGNKDFSCIKSVDGLTVSIEYRIDFYSSNKLLAITEKHNYQLIEDITVNDCNQNNTRYANIAGYQYICEVKDNLMTVSKRVKIDKYKNNSFENIDLTADFDTIKNSLTNLGYTCN